MALTEKQRQALDKLYQAKAEFLLELGWTKDGRHFSPPKRIAWVYPGDKVYIGDALHAQESYLDDSI